MKILRHSIPVLLSALLASAVFPARAAEDENAILNRMSGNYVHRSVVLRSQSTGNPDSFFPINMTLRMPKKKGIISGSLSVPGLVTYRFTGHATRVKVVGRTVRYSGNLRLPTPGGILTQRSFRATASPKGPKGELLSAAIKFSATVGANSYTLSNVFRGTK